MEGSPAPYLRNNSYSAHKLTQLWCRNSSWRSNLQNTSVCMKMPSFLTYFSVFCTLVINAFSFIIDIEFALLFFLSKKLSPQNGEFRSRRAWFSLVLISCDNEFRVVKSSLNREQSSLTDVKGSLSKMWKHDSWPNTRYHFYSKHVNFRLFWILCSPILWCFLLV